MAAEKQNCMIIGAAPITKELLQEFDPKDYFVICADAGYEQALKLGVTPDLIVGDFDSAEKEPPKNIRTLTLPIHKDVTDTMFAAMRGVAKGLRSFVLLGCLGGERMDHSIANIEVLLFLREHGAQGFLAREHTRLFLLREEKLKMTKMKGATVSVFPYCGPNCTVTYNGLEYPLQYGTLTCGGMRMGVSNSVVEDLAEIRVHSGTALVVVYQP